MAQTSETSELADDLELELRRVVQKAVSRGGAAQQHAVSETVHAVQRSFEAAIANALRERNIAVSPAARLPTELLVSAWKYSDVAVRIAASGVCHRWRATAVDSPGVWTHIDAFSNQHGRQCDCDVCDGDGLTGIHNLQAVALALLRSKARSFELTIVNAVKGYSVKFLTALAKLIASHSSRLVSLHVDFENPNIVYNFLRKFNCLPAVRTITATPRRISSPHELVPLKEIDMPVLHRLALPHARPVFSSHWPSTLPLQSLRILESTFPSSAALQQALTVCQHLDQLHIHLDGQRNALSLLAIDTDLQAMLDRIPHVRLSNVTHGLETWARKHFGIDCRKTLQWDLEGKVSGLEFGALKRLSQPVHLDARVVEGKLDMTCRDNSQRHIRLTFALTDDVCVRGVWSNLPADAIAALEVDATVWQRVVRHAAEMTTRLVVRLDAAQSVVAILSSDGNTARFPRLDTLCLRSTQRSIVLSLASVVVLIEALGMQAPLETLELDGVAIKSPEDAPVRRITDAARPGGLLTLPACLRLVETGVHTR